MYNKQYEINCILRTIATADIVQALSFNGAGYSYSCSTESSKNGVLLYYTKPLAFWVAQSKSKYFKVRPIRSF